jgi:DNA repair protein RadC
VSAPAQFVANNLKKLQNGQNNQKIEDYISWQSTPVQVAEIFSFLHNEAKEHFFTVHLDGKNRIICLDLVSIGSLNQSIVHPREVFKTSLSTSAAALLLVHNHPSGDPSPSSEDISITRRLKEGGELLGIKVLDHVIVGYDGYLSFVEKGLL